MKWNLINSSRWNCKWKEASTSIKIKGNYGIGVIEVEGTWPVESTPFHLEIAYMILIIARQEHIQLCLQLELLHRDHCCLLGTPSMYDACSLSASTKNPNLSIDQTKTSHSPSSFSKTILDFHNQTDGRFWRTKMFF